VKRVPGCGWPPARSSPPGGFFDARRRRRSAPNSRPKFISSDLPDGLESLTYVEGTPPREPRGSLDQAAAEESGLAIGDEIELASVERARAFRLVGLTRLGDASFGGASIAQVILPVAQRITGKLGRFDQISVAAGAGVSPQELKRRVERVMPPTARVETAEENANRNSEQVRDNLGFLRTALLVFAFVALFVGAFLIFNTFSITVAQRITEFGMLRTLGASRGQILASVVVEALAIGLLGALLGLAGGFAIARASTRSSSRRHRPADHRLVTRTRTSSSRC
jgi:putative ABC transport system permease protein